jgi:general stress protein 26
LQLTSEPVSWSDVLLESNWKVPLMTTPQQLKSKLWKAMKSDMTMMIGLQGERHGHMRPMTAQFRDDSPSIWFFTSKKTYLAEQLPNNDRAVASFVSKGHDLFASLYGPLAVEHDPELVDELWNPFVAAWFEGGKDDPTLALLRFEPQGAEIWLDASSILSGIKMLLGTDPKEDFKDKVATVTLP